jgi:hypothetical protein
MHKLILAHGLMSLVTVDVLAHSVECCHVLNQGTLLIDSTFQLTTRKVVVPVI